MSTVEVVEAVEAVEDKIEHDGRLYLPVPHPLFDAPPAGSVRERLNGVWKGGNFFLRGLYGTHVEWGISFMDLALEYPRLALAALLTVGIAAEEIIAEKPVLQGTYHYVLHSLDPEAAEIVFPPETTMTDAEMALDSLAAKIVEGAAKDYYNSPEYRVLEAEVQADMHYQVSEAVYGLAGMTERLESLRATRAAAEAVEAAGGINLE
jgi:hypothetical protein